jgi:leader peptidase (prepilin peptidase)/N-methyltransferase
LRFFLLTCSTTSFPDELNVALLVLGLLHAGLLTGAPTDWDWASLGVLNLRNAAIGALVGAGLFSAIAILGRVAFRRDAMGHGDIKLVRGMGALLLAPGMLVAFGVSIATGASAGRAVGVLAVAPRACPRQTPRPTTPTSRSRLSRWATCSHRACSTSSGWTR